MSEHTAGPWHAQDGAIHEGPTLIAVMTEWDLAPGETQANARLIAAAPIMHTLFELVFRYWMTSDQPTDKEIYVAIAEVDEHFRAIAKAEGR